MPIRDGSVTLIYLYWLTEHKAPSYLEGLGGVGGGVGGGAGYGGCMCEKNIAFTTL